MTDHLTTINVDRLSAAIKDHETNRAVLAMPCPDRLRGMQYLDDKQQAHARRIARKTAPGGQND